MPEFLEILRCPETKQKLIPATPELLQQLHSDQAAGKVFYKSGKFAIEPVEAGLVREDGLVLYPVREEIPVLVAEEAIVLVKFPAEIL